MQADEVTVGSVVRLPCNCWHKVTQKIDDLQYDDGRKASIVWLLFENGNEYAFRASDWIETK